MFKQIINSALIERYKTIILLLIVFVIFSIGILLVISIKRNRK